jgi:hypothetical protein
LRAIYTKLKKLAGRHKICRTTKIEDLLFLSSDRFCVVRLNFAVSCN